MNKWVLDLLRSKQTIFSVRDLGQFIWHGSDAYLRNRISFLEKKWIIKNVARGIYATRGEYDRFELANKIYSPSYISFFSALYYHKVIFQYQSDVYLAYRKTDTKKLKDFSIILKNLKSNLLFNPEGILVQEFYSIAGRERAFLDTLYIFWETYFDNLSHMDWEYVLRLVKIYDSLKLERLVQTYIPHK